MAKKKCGCETRSGKKCKNYALPSSNYCSVHQDCEKDYKKGRRSAKRSGGRRRSPRRNLPPSEYRCACTNKNGTNCKKWTTMGSMYCNVHADCAQMRNVVQVPYVPPTQKAPIVPFDDSMYYTKAPPFGYADLKYPAGYVPATRAAAPAAAAPAAAAAVAAPIVAAAAAPAAAAAGVIRAVTQPLGFADLKFPAGYRPA